MRNRSYSIKESEINKNREWLVLDAKDVVLGRLAAKISVLIRGKHKSVFTPHMNCGDKVIVVNTKHLYLSGKKLSKNGKQYYKHTGYPGGLKTLSAQEIKSTHPERLLKFAVKNMLPNNSLSRIQLKKNLFIYADKNHPHNAQSPKLYDFAKSNHKNCLR